MNGFRLHADPVQSHVQYMSYPKAFCHEDQKGAAKHGSGALRSIGYTCFEDTAGFKVEFPRSVKGGESS